MRRRLVVFPSLRHLTAALHRHVNLSRSNLMRSSIKLFRLLLAKPPFPAIGVNPQVLQYFSWQIEVRTEVTSTYVSLIAPQVTNNYCDSFKMIKWTTIRILRQIIPCRKLMISVAIIKEKKFCIKMNEFIIINCSRLLFHCSILAWSRKFARVGSLRSAKHASWHHQCGW